MSVFEHSRWRVFNISQHPLRHSLDDFLYSNARLPGVTTPAEAIDYLIAAVYPNYKSTVATPAALPVVATVNDYVIVSDDGDGKAAGYVYVRRDNVTQWEKRYDVDWSFEAILTETVNRTFPMYVHKWGQDDTDETGATIAGALAGQRIYGGASANTHLTLYANAGDVGGGNTGYIQAGDSVRPVTDSAFDLGTNALRWANIYTDSITSGTLTATGGSITDTSGAISFDDENLVTTGNLTAANGFFSASLEVGPLAGNALVLAAGSITDQSGAISFGDENLSTTGTLASGVLTVSADMVIATGSITSASGAIDFGNENLSTTGTLSAGNATVTRLDSDNVRVDGNTISILDANGSLILQANGTGVVDVQSAMTTIGQTVTGVMGITGQLNIDNLRLDANTISATNLNGNILLAPNGTGEISLGATSFPAANSSYDLGKSGNVFNSIWLDGNIEDGSTSFVVSELMALRNAKFRDAARTLPVQAGDALFYDAVSGTWLASAPDTEIDHGTVSGLLDDDHTQYALLAGRAGGQTLVGGTAAGEDLALESTAHATKGSVYTKSNFEPFTNASFAVTWQGTDLGGSSNYFRDVYTKGEFKGLRLESFTFAGLPAASATSPGRLAWTTDNQAVYVDIGGSWLAVGATNKFSSDTVWSGETTQSFDVSADIDDAREAIWQLCDNANSFERIYTKIEAISATHVRVTVSPALPAGSYRLLGIE